ncbi:MAG: hypothetical protein M3Y71_18705 [Actinomycetota bacterium]|nr:hypothetical protein [Actinomycetota bacterium]
MADGSGTVGPLATTLHGRRHTPRLYAAARSFLLTVTAVLGAAGVLAFGLGLVLGVRPVAVTSGSMAPSLPVGCLVISRDGPAAQVQVGSIVTLQRLRGSGPVTQRVVKATARGDGAVELVLRGDADDQSQSYVASTAASYVMQVPWVGYPVTFFEGRAGLPTGIAVVLLLVGVLLVDPKR